MKKLLLFLILPLMLFMACDDGSSSSSTTSSTAPELTTVPDADPVDDGKASGVYKGVIADEDTSGTFMIDIADTASGRAQGDVYSATLTGLVDGTTLTAVGTATEDASGNLDVDIELTYLSMPVVFNLRISPIGVVTDITVTVDGYSIQVAAAKEESDALLEAWEGTYRGESSGTWNFILDENSINGVFSGETFGSYSGTKSGSSISVTGDAAASGTLTTSGGSGVWSSSGLTGTWSGSRTR